MVTLTGAFIARRPADSEARARPLLSQYPSFGALLRSSAKGQQPTLAAPQSLRLLDRSALWSSAPPSQIDTALDGMICFGVCGLRVPAVTTSPSSSFSFAKRFASVSVSNVLVSRGCLGFGNIPRRCTSKVTYQACLIDCSKCGGSQSYRAEKCSSREPQQGITAAPQLD